MKKDTHPQTYPTIFVDTSCGAEFFTLSTLKGHETREIEGVTYQVVDLEISSASHPFYTGKQVLVDTARRVEKFQERAGKQATAMKTRKGKAVKKAKKQESKKTKESTGKKAKKIEKAESK